MDTEILADRIRTILGPDDGYSERKMFGGLCFMINGHMTAGVTKDGSLMLRVGPQNYEGLLAESEARPMDFTGKPMKGMLYVDLDQCPDGETGLGRWLGHALEFTSKLPPKKK